MKFVYNVIPAKAGIQLKKIPCTARTKSKGMLNKAPDSRLRGNDETE
jgi:hypothetical protein